ncbi:uncharacterized protein LOC129594774 [Paramacrobiotus metropolitanus]|uniref:uncharacterized protein LOC129594774 n=1 Tax=Paramacrobiotus metropolitanus TaxID=2943436 RepID=UPI002445792A|nr:uncharacterized protein LOC129594774 [Paramacrobiotus metropolitanus]
MRTTSPAIPRTALCTPTEFRRFGPIGHCAATDELDDKCSHQEISSSLDCEGVTDGNVPIRKKQLFQNVAMATYNTPAAPDTCDPTPADQLGPYYANGAPDDRIILSGTVRFRQAGFPCGRAGRAMLDLWQANPSGLYSVIPVELQSSHPVLFELPGNFTLETNATGPYDPHWACRLKIITGDDGYYSLSSVVPGRYQAFEGWRPAHIHFRVTPLDAYDRPLNDTFTTQIYFYHDMFNSPNDPCPPPGCKSGDPRVTVFYSHDDDFKTFIGRQDFLI